MAWEEGALVSYRGLWKLASESGWRQGARQQDEKSQGREAEQHTPAARGAFGSQEQGTRCLRAGTNVFALSYSAHSLSSQHQLCRMYCCYYNCFFDWYQSCPKFMVLINVETPCSEMVASDQCGFRTPWHQRSRRGKRLVPPSTQPRPGSRWK